MLVLAQRIKENKFTLDLVKEDWGEEKGGGKKKKTKRKRKS